MHKSYLTLCGILFIFSILAIPGVQAGHLITQSQTINFNLFQSIETDTITLITENNYDIDLQFIALNPAGISMPITSVIGFNTIIEKTTDGFKWSYDLQLPNSDFVAKILISASTPITILEDKYIVVDGSLISFDDVLKYGYSYTLTQLDTYSAEFEIIKDYGIYGLSPGNMIIIDPTITAYPENDGYLRQDNVGTIDTFLSGNELDAGSKDLPVSYVYRTYIKFDTSDTDSYDTIINATLKVYLTDIHTTGGQTCNIILQSISDFEDLGSLDWDISNITINNSWISESDPFDIYYEHDVTDYIEKEGITAFRILGDYEVWDENACDFHFDSNETANTPELEIYWDDGTEAPTKQLFNVSHSTSKQIYAEASCGWLLPSTLPYDPKIACETDGDSCVAIFYDDRSLCSRGLKYSLSRDGFDTIEFHGIVTGKTFSSSIYLDAMRERGGELPYDIVYDDNTNHYYIVLDNKVFVIPTFDPGVIGVTPYRVTDGYALAVGGSVGADLSLDCCVEVNYQCAGSPCSCSTQIVHPLRFVDNDATKLFGTFQGRAYRTTPTIDWDGWLGYFTYDVTNTTTTGNGNLYDCVQLDAQPSCSGAGTLGEDYYSGYAEWSGSAWKYNIEAQLDYCTGETDIVYDKDNFGSPNDDFNHFYFGGNFYWKNQTNYAIYSSESSDLSSFGTSELQYAENTLINEAINQSDASGGGNANYYIWYRSSTLTDGTDGIWVQEQTTYPVVISSNEDMFVTLSCTSEDYTTTGSGKIMQLFTPCISGNTITFISDFTPQVDSQSFDFNSCNVISYSVYYPDNPYDFTFTVKDALTNDVLENVEIDLTGEASKTTNIFGKAVFNIQGIDSVDFKVSQTGCQYDLSADGIPKIFYGEAELSGYVDNGFTITPGTKTIGDINIWDFDNNKLITMYPDGVVLDVHVYTSDGQEIFVDNYNVSVTGNNDDTFTFSGTNPTRRNWNREVPATFLLYDNRTSYNITISLTYPGGSDTQDLLVVTNKQYDTYFYLPYTLLDLPCSDITDCVPDFCSDDGYHHQLIGCDNNQCQYLTTDCFSPDLCDVTTGCFAFNTDVQCTNDIQCQNNENVTYCIDLGSMYIGQCGSDGFCKQTEKVCSTFCNETIGYCNEKALCRIAQIEKIGYEYPGGSIYADAVCNFENSGTDICVIMGLIPKAELTALGLGINDILFSHEGFSLLDVGDSYKVSDVSVSCSDSCEMTLNFCPSGECSIETGKCLTGQSDTAWEAMIWGTWVWIAGIIPLELRMFAWMVFTLFVMLEYRKQTKGSNSDQSTIMVGLLMLFAGFGVGFIHWIFLVIIGVLTAFLLSQKMGQ